MTVKDLLDAIDRERESEEMILLMNDGKVEMSAMVCAEIWDYIEDREINSIQAEGDNIKVWLEDKK